MERDKNLHLRLLPAQLIIKNFVKGGGEYNSEIFLRELINHSEYLLKKSEGQRYSAPPSESHGEPDCISDTYTLDFKLAASESALRARNELSSRRAIDTNGVMAIGVSKKSEPQLTLRIHAALRHLSTDDLINIRQHRWDNNPINHDIKAFLRKLETRKNILLFYPYEFFFNDNRSYEAGLPAIQKALAADFGRAMEYRAAASRLDTYFSFIYSNRLIILSGRDFSCLDSVPLDKSPAYARMSWGYDIFK